MTPREQSLEILFEYKYENNYGIEPNTGIKGINFEQAKQCALITIDYIINVTTGQSINEWYKEVKKEIEKL